MGTVRRDGTSVGRFRLTVLRVAALTALTVAQLADLGTFLRMVGDRGLDAELNPFVVAAASTLGLAALAVAKVALIVVVWSTFTILARARPRTAATVLTLGTAAGLLGAASNVLAIL
jgi:hypothetical protein